MFTLNTYKNGQISRFEFVNIFYLNFYKFVITIFFFYLDIGISNEYYETI